MCVCVCVCVQVEAVLRELRYVRRETDVELHPHAAQLLTFIDDITQSHLSLSHMVSCYNQAHSHTQVQLTVRAALRSCDTVILNPGDE